MRKAIKFTPRAREDIRKIWRYTLDQWNEDQADSYIRAPNDKIQQLSAHPKLGKARQSAPRYRQGLLLLAFTKPSHFLPHHRHRY